MFMIQSKLSGACRVTSTEYMHSLRSTFYSSWFALVWLLLLLTTCAYSINLLSIFRSLYGVHTEYTLWDTPRIGFLIRHEHPDTLTLTLTLTLLTHSLIVLHLESVACYTVLLFWNVRNKNINLCICTVLCVGESVTLPRNNRTNLDQTDHTPYTW